MLLCGGFLWLWQAGATYSLVAVLILTVEASLVAEHRLWSSGSVVVVQGLSCSKACVIFLDQGLNPCPLHWQMDS